MAGVRVNNHSCRTSPRHPPLSTSQSCNVPPPPPPPPPAAYCQTMKFLTAFRLRLKIAAIVSMLAAFALPPSFATEQASAPLNLFSGGHSVESLQALLISRADWKPFPPLADRAAWEGGGEGGNANGANRVMLDAALREAGEKAARPWLPVPATHALAILRTGDRSAYQAIANEKRRRLMLLMLAELRENKGRFIDPLINGVWSICEESFWGTPAHLWDSSRRLTGLPDTATPTVDLNTAETAASLAWVDYFLGPRLDEISPLIRKRIRDEIRRRVLAPLDNNPDPSHQAWFWLQNVADGTRPNNWNPWIVSNWLTAILLMETDAMERARMCLKALRILDNYVNPYPADGGCDDEGPVYWNVSTASVHDCAALLNLATRDAFKHVFENEKKSATWPASFTGRRSAETSLSISRMPRRACRLTPPSHGASGATSGTPA
ncbi:hypothetical protein Ga0100231_002190 [Opitutaceae bacterium TAV4]|nr:hypothetical protein Ga0100231_002190 [Opitutaceae bacterium TAV4]